MERRIEVERQKVGGRVGFSRSDQAENLDPDRVMKQYMTTAGGVALHPQRVLEEVRTKLHYETRESIGQ
jgi:hypothetical protein